MDAREEALTAYRQGRELFDRGEVSKALPILLKAVEYDPNYVDALFILGVCHFRKKDFQAAENEFRRVLGLNNSHHVAHYYLGLTLERQNRSADAILEYRFALTIKPDFEEARKKLKVDTGFQSTPGASAGPASSGSEEPLEAGKVLYQGRRRMSSFDVHWVLIVLFLVGPVLFNLVVARPKVGAGPFLLLASLAYVNLVLRSRTTKYTIHENRIDFDSGILFKKRQSVWVYEIENTRITRSPINLLTGDAKLHLETHRGNHLITGLGDQKFINEFWDELREGALLQRRAMKKWWI